MKIQDILKEEKWSQDSTDFKSKKTGVDPVTGTISWDIEYTPLKGVDDAIEDAYQDYKAVLKKYPEDQKLDQQLPLLHFSAKSPQQLDQSKPLS